MFGGKKAITNVGIIVLVCDMAGLVILTNIAHQIRVGRWLEVFSWQFITLSIMTLMMFYVLDVYRLASRNSIAKLALQTFAGVTVAGLLTVGIVYMLGETTAAPIFWRGILPVSLSAFAIFAMTIRVILAKWTARITKNMRWLCIGSGERAEALLKEFKESGRYGDIYLLSDGDSNSLADKEPTFIGTLDQLDEFLDDAWSGVILSTEKIMPDSIVSKLLKLRLRGIRIYETADFYEELWSELPVIHLKDGWFLGATGFNLLQHNIGLKIKRVIDISLAILLFVLLLPVMIVVGIAIRLDSKGPVLFGQKRVGQNGITFKMYKFRSMVKDAEKDGAKWAQENDPRITRLGKILRKSRIDELPQLWNVIKGDMSFIGPRPERPEFSKKLERKIPYYNLRHLIKPGITGWAQVLYPYGSSIGGASKKLGYELFYIKNYSVYLDLLIVIKTIRIMLYGKGR